ncbi:hypothetical protein OHA53_19655 [Streptomyces althioticus]|uniref:hypothetical protein n=1 Tax=Streptomyces althioticus TaxID=83380 RepID=UPI003873227A|nr:hypothetical protein OHA53_19655 [Streptomyces althioticus]
MAAHLVADHYPDGRPAGHTRVITCPYCRMQHTHGEMLGHRAAHCTDYVAKRHQVVDPRDTRNSPGYVLCDPAESINWQLEYVYGQLFVLRNRLQRLRADAARMDPLSARERSVKANLQAEIARITRTLRKAGVNV